MNQKTLSPDLAMYGVADMEQYISQMKSSITYKSVGGNMIVAGLMSDAQELIAMDDNERARKTLNRAKRILFEIMDGNLIGNQKGE